MSVMVGAGSIMLMIAVGREARARENARQLFTSTLGISSFLIRYTFDFA